MRKVFVLLLSILMVLFLLCGCQSKRAVQPPVPSVSPASQSEKSEAPTENKITPEIEEDDIIPEKAPVNPVEKPQDVSSVPSSPAKDVPSSHTEKQPTENIPVPELPEPDAESPSDVIILPDDPI